MPQAESFAERRRPAPAATRPRRPPVVHFPESDGKPMSETARHYWVSVDFAMVLRDRHAGRADAYVGGNMFMYFREGDPLAVVSPDLFVTYGVAKEPLRDTWKVWEEGKAADFVMEVTSKSTRREDEVKKKAIYERLEVKEYWQFDPTGDYLDPILKGRRLGPEGEYRDLPLEARDGGLGRYSEVLGLDLRLEDGRLRFFDPEQGEYLLTPDEQRRALQAIEAQRDAAQSGRRQDAAALRAAEARIAELERQLRSSGHGAPD